MLDRFQFKKKGKTIKTKTYVMTFNTSKILTKIKVGYTIERVEQFVPNPLRCYICQKYDIMKTLVEEKKCAGNVVKRSWPSHEWMWISQ